MVALKELTQILGIFRQLREPPKAESDSLSRPRCLICWSSCGPRPVRTRTSSSPMRSGTGSGRSGSRSKTVPTAPPGGLKHEAEEIASALPNLPGTESQLMAMTTSASVSGEVLQGRVVGIDPGLNVTGYAVIEPAKSSEASMSSRRG